MKNSNRFKILLIEDDESSALIALSMLLATGSEVVLAKNGEEATSKLMNHNFDLVILDWEMPIRDGAEVMRLSDLIFDRTDSWTGPVPLVLYTGIEASQIDMPHVTCFKLVDYWYKMDSLSNLNIRAKSLLDRLQRRAV